MAINKGPGNGEQIASIMQGYNTKTNVTTDNHNSIILGSGNVIGDRVNALVVGDNFTVENSGIATTNLTVTGTLNGRSVEDILPTYTKYIALISQSSTSAPTVEELENTIGPIVWSRVSAGIYEGTLTGVFTVNKTYVMISQLDITTMVGAYAKTIDIIQVESPNDTDLVNHTLEIRVYE